MNFVIQFTVRTTVELSSLQGVAKAYCDKDVAFLSLSVCKDRTPYCENGKEFLYARRNRNRIYQ